MNSWHSYPKVWNLGHPQISELFEDEVLVEEKIDGSQFSFGIFGEELKCKSKSKELIMDAPEKMFEKAVETVKEIAPLLKCGYTYRAEYLQKPKHNVLAYDSVPTKHLMIFDINMGLEQYLDYEDKVKEALSLGLDVVPTFGKIKISNPEDVAELLERESCLGGQKIEGLVFKNYQRFGRDGKALLGKYVSEKFREKHKKDWKDQNPTNKDIIAMLGQSYRTNARWDKAVMHLRERGDITETPKDIGLLIKELQHDLDKEIFDEVAEKLAQHAMPIIKRIVSRGFPEWYKQKLMGQQFEEER